MVREDDAGRRHRRRSRGARAVDLNALETPDALVPLLTHVRRRARAAAGGGGRRRLRARDARRPAGGAAAAAQPERAAEPHALAQVGDLARVRVATRDLDRRSDAPELRARLATLREGRFNPETIRVLDGDDLRALRPQSSCASTARVQPAPARRRASLFVGAFALVHGVRRVTGTIGDPLSVPAVCALCGLGLVTMVSVNDPLRDRLLFDVVRQRRGGRLRRARRREPDRFPPPRASTPRVRVPRGGRGAVGAAARLRIGAGRERREGEPVRRAAGGADSAAGRAVPRRLFRAALGVPARAARDTPPATRWLGRVRAAAARRPAAGGGRHGAGAAVLLLSARPRSGARHLVRVPRHLQRGARAAACSRSRAC